MVEACTGVIFEKFIDAVASRIHSDSVGVSASHDLEDDSVGVDPLSGAMLILRAGSDELADNPNDCNFDAQTAQSTISGTKI